MQFEWIVSSDGEYKAKTYPLADKICVEFVSKPKASPAPTETQIVLKDGGGGGSTGSFIPSYTYQNLWSTDWAASSSSSYITAPQTYSVKFGNMSWTDYSHEISHKGEITPEGNQKQIDWVQLFFKNDHLQGLMSICGAVHEMNDSDLRVILTRLFVTNKTVTTYVWQWLYANAPVHTQEFINQRANTDFNLLEGIKLNSHYEILRSPMFRALRAEWPTADLDSLKVTTETFREQVIRHFGTDSPKLVESLWKVAVIHTERMNDGLYALTITPKHKFNHELFTALPVLFKIFGFDHFYRFLEEYQKPWDSSKLYGDEMSVFVEKTGALPNIGQKYFTVERLVNFFIKDRSLSNSMSNIKDAIRMLDEFKTVDSIPAVFRDQYPNGLEVKGNFSSFKEWHDKISDIHVQMKNEAKKKPIDYHPMVKKMSGLKKGKFEFKLAESTVDLNLWGSKLGICIASYDDKAVNANTILGTVLENGTPAYCVEFSVVHMWSPENEGGKKFAFPVFENAKRFVQFRGKRNADPPKEALKFLDLVIDKWIKTSKEEGKVIKMTYSTSPQISSDSDAIRAMREAIIAGPPLVNTNHLNEALRYHIDMVNPIPHNMVLDPIHID